MPGDNPAGTPGEDSIEPLVGADPNPDAGLITAEINTPCLLSVEVTEFAADDPDLLTEKLWTAYSLGDLEAMFDNAGIVPWATHTEFRVGDGWFQVADAYPAGVAPSVALPDDDMPTLAAQGSLGTIIVNDLAVDPVDDFARYLRLPFGVKAKNRIDADGDFVYETIALAGDYTATMVATLAAVN
ncbi:MAG: hypothetical protein HPY44_17510 [Armatimonadetes bacterium]|nr:hypothetical protein [Armatimonadota bacterium]